MTPITSLQSVLAKLQSSPPDTYLFLDIDETCLHAGEGYGSETWYDQVIQSYLDAGLPYAQAVMQANDLWESKQDDLQYFLTEPVLISILDEVSKRKAFTMGLTARRPEMATYTRKQLEGLGVDLLKTAIVKHPLLLGADAAVENGIIFGGPLVDKGQALGQFLDAEKLRPAQVLFVDDKAYHCESVERVCTERKIPVFCFCYQRPK